MRRERLLLPGLGCAVGSTPTCRESGSHRRRSIQEYRFRLFLGASLYRVANYTVATIIGCNIYQKKFYNNHIMW